MIYVYNIHLYVAQTYLYIQIKLIRNATQSW